MKKENPVSQEMLTLAILTVLTVFTWISFDIYRTVSKPTPFDVPPEQLQPLDPVLKTEVIDRLSERESYGKDDLTTVAVQTPTPTVSTSSARRRL